MQAAATLYLVPRALDRLLEGRRLAAPLLSRSESDTRMALRGTHPDLIELVPPEKKHQIGIDQVRAVIRVGQFSPVQSRRKVCLVPRAEALTPQAANALLKILEEPPRELAFVILAEHPNDLLPTIVSRCRIVRIAPAARSDLIHRLTEAGYSEADAGWLAGIPLRDGDTDRLVSTPIEISTARATAVVALRGGTIVDLAAMALGDQPIHRLEALLQVLRRIAQQDPSLLTTGVRTLAAQDRDTLAQFLHELLAVCHALVRSSCDRVYPLAEAADPRNSLGNEQLRNLCHAIDDAHRSIDVYTPPEAVLLSLMMTPGDDLHGH